ncbi:MAG: mechanosensitive ion channel family protein [Spirochaetes bacterium]|nr:mechanosensitive ion channel family protein [Spirochaetota bacterium]
MWSRTFFFVTLSIVGYIVTALFAQDQIGASRENQKKLTVAIFRFYDYANSKATYLETYIPELIEKHLPFGNYLKSASFERIDELMKKYSATPKELYDTTRAILLARELKADIAVVGRYLFEGKIFILQGKVFDISKEKVLASDEYQSTISDNNLLEVVASASTKLAEWITHEALSEVVVQLEAEKITPLRTLFYEIRDSRVGIIFTNKWLCALLIVIGFIGIAIVAKIFMVKILVKLTSKTQTTVDDQILAVAQFPIRWIIIAFGFKLALLPLKLSASVYLFVTNIILSFIIALAGYLALRISDILIHEWGVKISKKLQSRLNDDLVPLFTKMSRIFIIIITALLVLTQFRIEITPLLASLGIAGFAIGFAIKDTLANVIGGIILTLDKSFAVGDKVSIDGEVGVVHEVGLRNTLIQTYDNEVIVIPNGELVNKKFKNFALPNPEIRVVVDFSVAYGSDVNRVQEVVLAAVKTVSEVKEEPIPEVLFMSMGEYSLNFQARFWIPMFGNQLMKKVEATTKIYNALNDAGIGIPFPTRTVYVRQ